MKIRQVNMVTLTLILLLTKSLFSQSNSNTQERYYDEAKVSVKLSSLNLDTISYQIAEVEDNREDRTRLGSVYYGMLNHHALYMIKNGLKGNFMAQFEKATKRIPSGHNRVKVVFNQLSIFEREEDLGKRGGRSRQYRIAVDYYLLRGGGQIFLLSDKQEIDSLAPPSMYDMDKFCDSFFQSSLRKLDTYISKNQYELYKAEIVYPNSDVIDEGSDDYSAENRVHQGEVWAKVRPSRPVSYKTSDVPEKVKEAIVKELEGKARGNYLVEYRLVESENKVVSSKITLADYKRSTVSPYWYTAVPMIAILGFMSGYNSGN